MVVLLSLLQPLWVIKFLTLYYSPYGTVDGRNPKQPVFLVFRKITSLGFFLID